MSEFSVERIFTSDISSEDQEIINTYNGHISNQEYSDAVTNLGDFNGGIRAWIINKIIDQIKNFETYLLNLTADKDTYYSYTEPTDEEMNGKKFWIKPI